MKRVTVALLVSLLVLLLPSLPAAADTTRVPTLGGGGGDIVIPSSFLDGANFKLKNTADPTKILQWDLTGITTGTTRIATPPNANFTIAALGVAQTFSAVNTFSAAVKQDGGSTDSGFWARDNGANPFVRVEGYDANTAFISFNNTTSTGNTDVASKGNAVFGTVVVSDLFAVGYAGRYFMWQTGPAGATPVRVVHATLTDENAFYLGNGKAVAAPTAGILQVGAGGSGSNIAAGAGTIRGGAATGNALPGTVTVQRGLVGASGSTAQSYGPAFVVCGTKTLSNTSATAQTVGAITTTSSSAGGVSWFFTVTASNGTAVDAETGDINVSWNNNAGTVAATASAALGAVQSNGSGTLAATPTVTVATNVVSLKYTPTWTVIVPTVVTGYATFIVNGVDAVVCQ